MAETSSSAAVPASDSGPPPTHAGYRSAGTRARVASGFLIAAAVVEVLSAAWQLGVPDYGTVLVDPDSATESELVLAVIWDLAGLAVGIGGLAVLIGTGLAFLAWHSRMVDNLPALGLGTPDQSPRWAIAGWFIPIVNLFWPYQSITDAAERMAPPDVHRRNLILAWWLLFLAYGLLGRVSLFTNVRTGFSTFDTWALDLIASLLGVVAAVLAVRMVRSLQGDADRVAGARFSAQPAHASGLPSGQTGGAVPIEPPPPLVAPSGLPLNVPVPAQPLVKAPLRSSVPRRLVAWIVDWVILGVAVGLVSAITQDQVVRVLISIGLPATYFSWFFSTSGQTLGKRLLGIRVVTITGAPLSSRTGLLRTIGYVLSWVPFGIGFLWAVWDREKQAGQDKIAATIVVPAVSDSEQLVGTVDLSAIRDTRRRWLAGLGIATLVVVGGFAFLVRAGVEEVNQMGPWPPPGTEPETVVSADLSGLGLIAGKPMDPRAGGFWTEGNYEEGALLVYDSGGVEAVLIWALRYPDLATASGDFLGAAEWAESNCGQWFSVNALSSGVIHCQAADAYNKTFWNERWIVDIVALEGSELTPDILIDGVRDALAAQWAGISQPSAN